MRHAWSVDDRGLYCWLGCRVQLGLKGVHSDAGLTVVERTIDFGLLKFDRSNWALISS